MAANLSNKALFAHRFHCQTGQRAKDLPSNSYHHSYSYLRILILIQDADVQPADIRQPKSPNRDLPML